MPKWSDCKQKVKAGRLAEKIIMLWTDCIFSGKPFVKEYIKNLTFGSRDVNMNEIS